MRVHPEERKKKHHTKSRHGCISCKKRHLRCDETRPECRRCIKDFGKCEGYLSPKTWLFESVTEDINAPDISHSNASPKSDSTGSGSKSDCPTLQTSVILDSSSEGQKSSVSPEPDYTRQKRWAPKSKSGCLICKRRRIKCDEGRPDCSRCSTSGRSCQYAEQPQDDLQQNLQVLESLQRKVDLFEDSDHPPIFKYINHTPYKTQIEHQTLLHWQNRTESCLVISRNFGNVNILGCDLPQGAWTYECLRHGLLSAASVTASVEQFAFGHSNERHAIIEALKQSSLAIKTMFNEKPPPAITVLVAFCFWFMEAWIGSWDRAVMHLASSARLVDQAFPAGLASESLAWYVKMVDTSVPQALRTPEILKLVQNIDEDYDRKFRIRLLWGTREAMTGIDLLDQARAKATHIHRDDRNEFCIILATHQAQMRFLSERWKKYAKLHFVETGSSIELPLPPITPVYTKVIEMMDYFFANDSMYDPFILGLRLKMIQRSLPLFIAGTNAEMRRDAALSIPIKVDYIDSKQEKVNC